MNAPPPVTERSSCFRKRSLVLFEHLKFSQILMLCIGGQERIRSRNSVLALDFNI